MFNLRFAMFSLMLMSSFSSNAGLILRDGGLVYDQEQDVTWLLDANFARTSGWIDANLGGDVRANGNGQMTWAGASAWAEQLNFLGHSNWRLPGLSVVDTNNTGLSDCHFSRAGGTDCGTNVSVENSEMAFLFYEHLNNQSNCDPLSSSQFVCIAPANRAAFNTSFIDALSGQTQSFVNLIPSAYWLAPNYAQDNTQAWFFNTNTGSQALTSTEQYRFTFAVHEGDIAASGVHRASGILSVPETDSWILFALVVMVLLIVQQRRRA